MSVKERVDSGEIPGPRLFMSGPFLQAEVEDWQKGYRWAVTSVSDATVTPLDTRPADGPAPATCPACGSFNTQLREGCEVCLDCGYSKCS